MNHPLDELYFEVCRIFLKSYWDRSGQPDGEMLDLLSAMNGVKDWTADPGTWADWLAAIEQAKKIAEA